MDDFRRRNLGSLLIQAVLGVALLAACQARSQKLPDALVPIPPIPAPLPAGSVKLEDPKDFAEIKLDFPIAPGPFAPTWDSIDQNHPGEIAWLRAAKFGIWVHFGPQAAGQSGDWYARKMYLPGTTAYANHLRDFGHPSESGYIDVLHSWNPTKLNPAALVQLYRDAGARFILVQAVHHDNFDNWNSKYQPWNSVNIGPHRDLLGEWAAASRRIGMRYGFAFHHEYSWWWYQPAFGSDTTGNKAGVPYDGRLTLADGKGKWWEGLDPRPLYTINLREYDGLVNFKYRPEGGIFINHLPYARWYTTQWALRILDAIDQYDPDFIYTDGDSTQPFSGYKTGTGIKADAIQRVLASFFNRTLQKHGTIDTFSVVKFHPRTNGVVTTSEETIPKAIKTDRPWIGENAVGDWFWEPNIIYDPGSVVHALLEYVSRDGNYVVCVPLKADGSLDPAAEQMLREIGDWMKINGQGIYGSHAWKVLGEGENGKLRVLPSGALGKKQAAFDFSIHDFRFTAGSDGSQYAFCMTVPPPGAELKISSFGTDAKLLQQPIKSVSLLGSSAAIDWRQEGGELFIKCPAQMPFKIAVAFKISE